MRTYSYILKGVGLTRLVNPGGSQDRGLSLNVTVTKQTRYLSSTPNVPYGWVTVTKRICEWCNQEFEASGTGRPPRYCRPSHKQRAYEQRRQAVSVGEWTPQLTQQLRRALKTGALSTADVTKPTQIRPVLANLIQLLTQALGSMGGLTPDNSLLLARYNLANRTAQAIRDAQAVLDSHPRSAKRLLATKTLLVEAAVLLADPPEASLRPDTPTTRPKQSASAIPEAKAKATTKSRSPAPPSPITRRRTLQASWYTQIGKNDVTVTLTSHATKTTATRTAKKLQALWDTHQRIPGWTITTTTGPTDPATVMDLAEATAWVKRFFPPKLVVPSGTSMTRAIPVYLREQLDVSDDDETYKLRRARAGRTLMRPGGHYTNLQPLDNWPHDPTIEYDEPVTQPNIGYAETILANTCGLPPSAWPAELDMTALVTRFISEVLDPDGGDWIVSETRVQDWLKETGFIHPTTQPTTI